MPKPSEQSKVAFQKLVPPDPAVSTRPMFGNLSGFAGPFAWQAGREIALLKCHQSLQQQLRIERICCRGLSSHNPFRIGFRLLERQRRSELAEEG